MAISMEPRQAAPNFNTFSNVEMLNLLEEIASQRLGVISKTYGPESERMKEILYLFTSSFFVADPHLAISEESIEQVWRSTFERGQHARQFLLTLHAHFVIAVGRENVDRLFKDCAAAYFVFKPHTFFNENNLSAFKEEEFYELLKLYPWFATYLLLGNVLSHKDA